MRESESLSEAERLFVALLEATLSDQKPNLAGLCDARPDLAQELRSIESGYRCAHDAFDDARRQVDDVDRSIASTRYEVRGEIARGGMGTVLEVWDRELRRVLAMKVLRSPARGGKGVRTRLESERQRSRLLNEAQILAQLDHPGILPVHEIGVNEEGKHFFTMPLVQGRDLAEVVAMIRSGEQGWSITRAAASVLKVCEAMAYAHERGLVHRDLKPHNVMVGRFGETYVMDWGLAKARGRPDVVDIRIREVPVSSGAGLGGGDDPVHSIQTVRRDEADENSLSPLRTYDGDLVGTPAYMAPEQAEGRIADVEERTDVYGVGALLYHLLGGSAPYSDRRLPDQRAMLHAVRTSSPTSLGILAPEAPPELRAIAEMAMQRDPAERYPSMREMADDLRAWLEGRVVQAHQTGLAAEMVKWAGRHRLAASLLAALLVFGVASIVVVTLLYDKSQERRIAALTAQADSMRRQAATMPISPAGLWAESFSDQFDDGILDRRWVIRGNPDRVEERDGSLYLESSNEQSPGIAMDPHVNVLWGDFDVEIDYALENFTVGALPLSERIAGITVDELTRTGLDQLIQLSRHAERDSLVTPGIEQSLRVIEGGGRRQDVCGEHVSSSGAWRIRRDGSTISLFCGPRPWKPLRQAEATEGGVVLRVFTRDYYIDDPFLLRLDTLVLRSYPPVPRPMDTELREDFSDGALDPRLMIWTDAGIVAPLDGMMYMEKLEGCTGSIHVGLNRDRHALVGDFEVSLSLRPRRGPPVRRGPVHLCASASQLRTVSRSRRSTSPGARADARSRPGIIGGKGAWRSRAPQAASVCSGVVRTSTRRSSERTAGRTSSSAPRSTVHRG